MHYENEPQQKLQYKVQRVTSHCRKGPVKQRTCTDGICCIMYFLLLIIIFFLSFLSYQHLKLTHVEVQQQLSNSQYGRPFLAIQKGLVWILLSLACVTAVCLILTFTALIFPSLVTYFYVPLMLIAMLLFGFAFLYRYFGQYFSFISQEVQDKYIQKDSFMTLVVGIIFIFTFLIALITITSKRQKLKNIMPVLKLAQICFWENSYMLIIAIFLSAMSAIFLYINVILLQISQSASSPQITHFALSGLIILQAFWTHGFMRSLSDFIFQSIAIYWYFNGKQLGQGYSKCSNNLLTSLGLIVIHLGTIIYGSIATYVPDFMQYLCCFNKCICKKISKYSHSITILQSFEYCVSTDSMYSFSKRAKNIISNVYVMGNFFTNLAKILLTMFGVNICYILLLQSNPILYSKILNLIPALLITFLASLQITNHFLNISGLVGDTLSFMHAVDYEIEKCHYGLSYLHSCPKSMKDIIVSVKPDYSTHQIK